MLPFLSLERLRKWEPGVTGGKQGKAWLPQGREAGPQGRDRKPGPGFSTLLQWQQQFPTDICIFIAFAYVLSHFWMAHFLHFIDGKTEALET